MFFDIHPGERDELLRKIPILQCISEPLNLIGNWDTSVARVAEIYFEKCDPKKRKTCKDEKEVRKWMENKYIWLVRN